MRALTVLLLKQCFLTVLRCNCPFFSLAAAYGGIIERERGAVAGASASVSTVGAQKRPDTHSLALSQVLISCDEHQTELPSVCRHIRSRSGHRTIIGSENLWICSIVDQIRNFFRPSAALQPYCLFFLLVFVSVCFWSPVLFCCYC